MPEPAYLCGCTPNNFGEAPCHYCQRLTPIGARCEWCDRPYLSSACPARVEYWPLETLKTLRSMRTKLRVDAAIIYGAGEDKLNHWRTLVGSAFCRDAQELGLIVNGHLQSEEYREEGTCMMVVVARWAPQTHDFITTAEPWRKFAFPAAPHGIVVMRRAPTPVWATEDGGRAGVVQAPEPEALTCIGWCPTAGAWVYGNA